MEGRLIEAVVKSLESHLFADTVSLLNDFAGCLRKRHLKFPFRLALPKPVEIFL